MTPNFAAIAKIAHGMMKPEVYEAIYQHALDAPPGHIYEVGTAHGAATICLALALKAKGSEHRVFTVDRHTGQSRQHYGGVEENTAAMLSAFEKAGVADRITWFNAEASRIPYLDLPTVAAGLLMLDADGAIDRDLNSHAPRLGPGTHVIVDDCKLRGRIKKRPGSTTYRVDLKHKLTRMLVDLYEENEVLLPADMVNETWFGRIGLGKVPHVTPEMRLNVYRKLTFSDAALG